MQKCSWKVGEKPEFGKLSLNFLYLSASKLSFAFLIDTRKLDVSD